MNNKPCNIVLLLIVVSIVLITDYSAATVFLTKDEALGLAFPEAKNIEKKSFFLTNDQVDTIQKTARTKVESKLFLFYVGRKDGEVLGYAAIDTHIVRTKSQTIMVVLNPDGSHRYTEILAFFEPPEYKASQNWLDLFRNKKIDEGLRIGKDIPNITGATLTSHSTANAVKKVLAVYEVLIKGAEKD